MTALIALLATRVAFGDLAQQDKFILARATAISSRIPGAILRFATQIDPSLQLYFGTPGGFLNLTSQIYVCFIPYAALWECINPFNKTRHLSVSAKTVYFVANNQKVPATKTSPVERLIVE